MKKGAFTLVEVLIATLILILGVLGAMKLNMVGLLSARKSVSISKNVFLAQSLAERIIATPSKDLHTVCANLQGYYEYSGENFFVSCTLIEYSERLKQVLLRVFKGNLVYNLSVYISEGD